MTNLSLDMPLWHLAPIPLAAGSEILPGNYGRIIHQQGEAHPLYHRESILEETRQRLFPNKPSRFDCCFAFMSLDTALAYSTIQMQYGPVFPLIYQVEPINTAATFHVGDYNAVQPLPRREETMEEIAVAYWEHRIKTTTVEYPGVACDELLIASPLKIIACIN